MKINKSRNHLTAGIIGAFMLMSTVATAQNTGKGQTKAGAAQQSPAAQAGNQQSPQQAAQQQSAVQSNGAQAQTVPGQTSVKTDYSDAQLKKFVEIYKKIAPQQQAAETQMQKAIEQQGLTTNRFNELAAGQQGGTPAGSPGTADEMKKFAAASQQLMVIQKDVQPKILKVLTDSGMKPEEFQQIVMAYQQSPVIQKRIQVLLAE